VRLPLTAEGSSVVPVAEAFVRLALPPVPLVFSDTAPIRSFAVFVKEITPGTRVGGLVLKKDDAVKFDVPPTIRAPDCVKLPTAFTVRAPPIIEAPNTVPCVAPLVRLALPRVPAVFSDTAP